MTYQLHVDTDVVVVDENGAVRGEQVAGNQTQRRRLARAVGSQETEALAGWHAEGDAVDGRQVTEVTRQFAQNYDVVLGQVFLRANNTGLIRELHRRRSGEVFLRAGNTGLIRELHRRGTDARVQPHIPAHICTSCRKFT